MSKRARRTIQDEFYQDWCFIRTQAAKNVAEEWTVKTPRPIQAPPSGRFYAIEIHSIEFKIQPADFLMKAGQKTQTSVSLTFAPRTGHDIFTTGPGYPHNLWWYNRIINLEDPGCTSTGFEQGSHTSKTVYTDDLGHGRITAGDDIFLQVATSQVANPISVEFAIQYTFSTVSCIEYTQHLTEISTAGY